MPSDNDVYRSLVDSLTDYAILRIDLEGKISVWNAGCAQIMGYAAEEVLGTHFQRLYGPSDEMEAQACLDATLREGRKEEERWLFRRDGSSLWAHMVIEPIREHDRVTGFGLVIRDRTERKMIDEQLAASQEQFRLLVQGVIDYAIYMLNPEGNITSWNQGAERIKGYTAEEIIGKHYSTFYTAEDVERREPWTNLESAARLGKIETEGWRVRKDGTRFWAHVVLDRLTDSAGNLIGFAKVTRDVTEQREAQQALEHAREALFQSQKLEAVGQLTGGVAHDFNNLLMVILGNLELLEKPSGRSSHEVLLQNAASAVRRGIALTQRMLAFARRQQLNLVEVNLHELLHGMSDLMRTSLGPAISIGMNLPGSLPKIRADINQLELCLLNLSVNARDAMPLGGKITISARAQSVEHHPKLKSGDYVSLSVTDIGEGMDEITLARATEPFFTTKGVGKGTGLGLSMVHGIAEQSGGTMTIESTPGRGTTVTLWLPTADKDGGRPYDADVSALPKAEGLLRATDAADAGSSILVVDDDPLVLATTVEMLLHYGYSPIAARSGQEALDLLLNNPQIKIVLTDQVMPGMTGTDLAKRVAQLRPDIRLILASGYMEVTGETEAFAAQLRKPYGHADLFAVLSA